MVNLSKNDKTIEKLLEIRENLGICQHHDAVAGTSKEYVSNDYIRMLKNSIEKGGNIIEECLNMIGNKFKTIKSFNSQNSHICIPSVSNFKCIDKIYKIHKTNDLYFTIVNPGVNVKFYPITFSVSSSYIQVLEIDKVSFIEKKLESDIFCQDDHIDKCTVNFFVNLEKEVLTRLILIRRIGSDMQVTASKIDKKTVKLISTPGFLLKYNFKKGFTLKINDLLQYKFKITHGYLPTEQDRSDSSIRPPDSNESGSYIMAPSKIKIELFSPLHTISQIYNGRNIIEICLRYLHSTIKIKIYKNEVYEGIFEVESILAPKDYAPFGMEYFLVMQSNINNSIDITQSDSQPEFWTDENGMKMMRRIKDFRGNFLYSKDELVADIFYPVNSAISIRKKNDCSFKKGESDYEKIKNDDAIITIFNDRSQSGGSLEKGQLLLDLNRWSLRSDDRGLPENLSEKPSSERYFTIRNMILIDNIGKKDLVYNIFQKRPILASIYQKHHGVEKLKNIELDYLSKLQHSESFINILINIDKSDINCFEIDFYHLDSKKTVIQFFNKHDPYFGQNRSCQFKFDLDKISSFDIYEVSLNTLIRTEKASEISLKATSFLKKHGNDIGYSVKPQDFRSFVFSSGA